MKKSYLIKSGLVLLLALSVSSYFYLCSQSIDSQQAESTLELVQTSANQLNNAGESFHKVASLFQRLLAH
jgi:hypothetical protein